MENKYLKAFNFLFHYEVLHKNVPNVGRATKGSFELECWKDIKELVDKETPVKRKQVEKWGSIKDCCPKCDNVVSPICCYCERCGQKFLRLDGSDK